MRYLYRKRVAPVQYPCAQCQSSTSKTQYSTGSVPEQCSTILYQHRTSSAPVQYPRCVQTVPVTCGVPAVDLHSTRADVKSFARTRALQARRLMMVLRAPAFDVREEAGFRRSWRFWPGPPRSDGNFQRHHPLQHRSRKRVLSADSATCGTEHAVRVSQPCVHPDGRVSLSPVVAFGHRGCAPFPFADV